MSLSTQKVFYKALLADTDVMTATDGRIYSVAIPVPDEDLDNEPVPYCVITFDGLANSGFTKDNSFEGDTDTVNIGIEITAESPDALLELAEKVRTAVISFFENYTPTPGEEDLTPLIPNSYTFGASQSVYDPDKPCFRIVLTYACDATP